MDIRRFFDDYSIRYAFNGDRHFKPGWINIPCPFCTGHSGNHLGFHLTKNYFKCWRCGYKQSTKVIERILNVDYKQAKQILKEYKGVSKNSKTKIKVKKTKFQFPDGIEPISKIQPAIDYMISRGFSKIDCVWLQKKMLLMATSYDSFLKKLDLSYRIVAPITFKNEIVSFQTRDYTDTSDLKYITCPGEVEVKKHKEILYNAPNPISNPVIILCEGIFDVWKILLTGYPATCCFGVEYTNEQLKLLKQYKKIIIFLDPDNAGKKAAKKLKRQLLFANKEVIIVKNKWGKDPGDIKVSLLNNILKPLMKFDF